MYVLFIVFNTDFVYVSMCQRDTKHTQGKQRERLDIPMEME